MGASAISAFPDRLLQNEKNTGRYQLKVGNGRFATARGTGRSVLDTRTGRAIEQILCSGRADLAGLPSPFGRSGAGTFPHARPDRPGRAPPLLAPDSHPYARSIAATLDPYRASSQVRFSSAV